MFFKRKHMIDSYEDYEEEFLLEWWKDNQMEHDIKSWFQQYKPSLTRDILNAHFAEVLNINDQKEIKLGCSNDLEFLNTQLYIYWVTTQQPFEQFKSGLDNQTKNIIIEEQKMKTNNESYILDCWENLDQKKIPYKQWRCSLTEDQVHFLIGEGKRIACIRNIKCPTSPYRKRQKSV